jgi:hypothetical protein
VAVASSASDWVSAVSESVSAVAAALVLLFAFVTLRPQLRDLQGQRAERETRQKEAEARQARLISAWPRARRSPAEGRVVVVHNGSDQPIHRCLVWLITTGVPDPDTLAELLGRRPSAWTSIVAPHDEYRYELKSSRGKPRPLRRPDIVVAFQDEENRSWWRNRNGVLAPIRPDQVKAYTERFGHVSGQGLPGGVTPPPSRSE